ncbi:hypothetical protein C4565_03635 [Candidatus Parcubacteria bacterium]|nr:MAG: hypothetical protein C4565_03635 [Candidatus Parcubacteria bacterium]
MIWMKVLMKGGKGYLSGGIGLAVAAAIAYLVTTYLPDVGLTEPEIIAVLAPILTGLFHALHNAWKHKDTPKPPKSISDIRPTQSINTNSIRDPFAEGKRPMPTRIRKPPSPSSLK